MSMETSTSAAVKKRLSDKYCSFERDTTDFALKAQKWLDILLAVASFMAAYFIRVVAPDLFSQQSEPALIDGWIQNPNYFAVLLMIVIIWYIVLDLLGIYGPHWNLTIWQLLWKMVKACSAGMLILILLMYLVKISNISRILMGLFYTFDISLMALSKVVIYQRLERQRKEGLSSRNILIVGSRAGARDVIEAIGLQPEAGFTILGCLETDKVNVGQSVSSNIKIIDTVDNLRYVLLNQVVDELIISMPVRDIENALKHIELAEQIGVVVRILPQWWIRKYGYDPKVGNIKIENFIGIPTLTISSTPQDSGALFIKSGLDYLAAIVLLMLSLPIYIVISVLIKIISPGPVFYFQDRCGLNGRRFRFIKLRTMVPDADKNRPILEFINESDGPAFKIENDPRIIPYIGKFLRRTGIDELPQIINILKGEMSLVGPRPPIPAEVLQYDIWQRRRLSMKPGMTCLWQVTPNRNKVSFNEWMRMDLHYIDNWSLWLDGKILIKTLGTVFRAEGM